ncbi:GILT-like protein 3 isoform X2 [Aedes albopictus]|uniref:Gamma-interferon inducible lysosomal thiol reductase n=1 Tax=Aedes albopictus TaxID=7160 RepID=A0ABM1XLD4_AEDAL
MWRQFQFDRGPRISAGARASSSSRGRSEKAHSRHFLGTIFHASLNSIWTPRFETVVYSPFVPSRSIVRVKIMSRRPKPVTKSTIMTPKTAMMIGILSVAIIFSLSAGQEIDSGWNKESVPNGNGTAADHNGPDDDKLRVTIYYEALCYDSISFITNQLAPAWEKLRDQMDLKLVPFGKAYIDDSNPADPVYYCQHGRRECTLNIQHGCILAKLPFEKAFPVVACLMKGMRTSFDQCIKRNQTIKAAVVECSQGQEGAKLYKGYEDDTNRVATPLSFVPTIEVDEVYDIYEQDRWLYRFENTFRRNYEKKFGRSLD